jgi:type I phosphodiesterase/nucleotide pyrophosphatase
MWIPRRSLAFVLSFVALAACTQGDSGTGRGGATSVPSVTPPSAGAGAAAEGSIERAVCEVPDLLLQRTWRGDRRDRSGDIQLLPQEPNFVGHGGLPHSGPWDYISDVPLLWYGPGHIRAAGEIDRRVTLADMAPTTGELIGFPFDAPDGRILHDALEADAAPPKLVVTVVWDGAGRDVLSAWPDDWPYLRSLIPQGAWYESAEVGSSPPSTAQIHATIGTGAFSHHHGIVAHHFRIGGTLTEPWTRGPGSLILPTIGDVYDQARENEPLIGAVATVAIHLGMLGHGSYMTGGDPDLAVTREIEGAATLGAEGVRWRLTGNVKPYYDFPAYVNRLPRISEYFGDVDRSDGQLDGAWHGHDLAGADTLGGFMTPARIPYQNDLVEEVVRREGFGADDVPDLLYINYKLTDEIGHTDSMNSVEMSDAVRATDEGLRELVGILDDVVGEGQWVMAVTADHGHTPDPDVSGAYVISPTAVADVTNAAFDQDGDDVRVVEYTQPTEVFVNTDELAEQGYTLNDVSAFLMGLTFRDVGSPTWPVPAEGLDDPAFMAAYPSRLLDRLDCVPRDE